jgi:methyltransferase (TIGR00027 family)
MLPERASGTALLVTALRALASLGEDPLIDDGAARQFLPRSWSRLIDVLARLPHGAALLRRAPDLISPGRLEHIALRTDVVDAYVRRELARGATELVILGAGFDTRAQRLPELARAIVFEVDHPATQAKKRERARGLEITARARHFVPVDFERGSLARALQASGFDASAPSAFIWEGVTMYLTPETIRATLGELRALVSPGSSLLLTYYDASGASGPPSTLTPFLAALLGEPFRTSFSPSEAAALLAEFGFSVEADSGRNDWARARGRTPRGRAQERVAVARRLGGTELSTAARSRESMKGAR